MFGIALVHWAFPPTVGGVETHLWEYSQRLAAAGHRVTVITGTPDADVPDGVELLYHEGLDLSRADRRDERDAQLEGWLELALGTREIDLVHGHNLHHFEPEPAQALTRLRAKLGFRLLHTYHSLWPDEPGHPAAEAVREWNGHCVVSKFLADSYASVLKLHPRPTVTYLGVGVSRYRDIPSLPDDLTTILLPGRLIPDKGAEQALLAFADLVSRRPDGARLRLLLTETPKQVDYHGERNGFRGRLNDLVAKHRLRDQVEFVEAGWAKMPALYERAHIVLCPSVFDEPLGLAALEAQCAARPVVATQVGGHSEAVVDKKSGLVVPADDVEQLARAIAQLLDDPALARTMGTHGRTRVLDRFDSERSYPTMLISYYRYLDEHGVLPPSAFDGHAPAGRETLDLGHAVAVHQDVELPVG
ncbi:glycosyltransferase involved in cell wall biosynthesis [Streptacidiphilus sp. MAP12-20]|uniref:glycosyltransferase family 4 protein n=1 Tax=Streptacidiphilus sp. MAP12-20 TaxID=3156299 RepID=UPI003518C108